MSLCYYQERYEHQRRKIDRWRLLSDEQKQLTYANPGASDWPITWGHPDFLQSNMDSIIRKINELRTAKGYDEHKERD